MFYRIIKSDRMTPRKIHVNFWDDAEIIELFDKIVKSRGTDRSSLLRETIRLCLAKHGLLLEDDTKILSAYSGVLKERGWR